MLSKSTTLEHVREAQILKEARRSLPKLSKMAAAELVLDAGIDLYESVDQDLFHDRLAGLVKDEVTAAEAAEQEQKDESSRGYRRWGQEEVKEESWRQYMEGDTIGGVNTNIFQDGCQSVASQFNLNGCKTVNVGILHVVLLSKKGYSIV